MRTKVKYNPVCDLSPVDQFGFVDLGQALVDGSVPFIDGIVEDSFNNIDDPRSIIGSPKNSFDALEMDASIRSFVAPTSDE